VLPLLLALVVVTALVGVGLLVRMYRANEPLFGMVGVTTLSGSGVLSAFYGMLASV
jgi:hypothetical protein